MAATQVRAFIGLGSNLDGPVAQVTHALGELDGLPATRCLQHSSLYRSKPLGPAGQPDYINAVALLETALDAENLFNELMSLENLHGRKRGGQRWGPRCLDLDILLYGSARIRTARLVIPHPGLPVREFVLYPLAEIEPGLVIPGVGPLQQLLTRCARKGLERLPEMTKLRNRQSDT